jgi:hypothetical protein
VPLAEAGCASWPAAAAARCQVLPLELPGCWRVLTAVAGCGAVQRVGLQMRCPADRTPLPALQAERQALLLELQLLQLQPQVLGLQQQQQQRLGLAAWQQQRCVLASAPWAAQCPAPPLPRWRCCSSRREKR